MSFQKFYTAQLNKVQMSRSDWSLLLPAKLSFFLKEPAKLFASITIRQFPFFSVYMQHRRRILYGLPVIFNLDSQA